MADKDFEFIRNIECYDPDYGSYTISLYKCLNCGSEDIEDIHERCECDLCEIRVKAEEIELKLGGICIIRNLTVSEFNEKFKINFNKQTEIEEI